MVDAERDRLREGLRTWGRRAVGSIWRRQAQGEPLSGEEERIARILREHSEYATAWEAGAGSPDGAGPEGVNPFLHVQIHAIVEGQIASGHPREVREAVERLEAGGATPHEAIHAAGKVLTVELHRALQEQRPFDTDAYGRSLRGLGGESR
ncbi:MAG: DUF1841 family protein [Acidobacteria bacterium]|nr:DUF1841 family protein [Acidobacteriota bacterium]